MERISVRGTAFIDEFGRERIFSGMNVCDKDKFGKGKYEYAHSADSFPFDKFKALGFNIIRLGFTWNVVEPYPKKYNEKFLDSIERFLDVCEEKGIYAYLDMHQDLYSPYCFGDGAPRWATLTDGIIPQRQKLVWAEGYFYGRACHRAFDNFWANKQVNGYGLQDYFADMWAHVAERFCNHPALFGFDILNEPFPGSSGGTVFRKLIANLIGTTLTDKRVSKVEMIKEALGKEKPRALDQYDAEVFKKICSAGAPYIYEFDTERYSPFLSKTATAIRGVTDKGIIFMENCYYSNLGIPCSNAPVTINGERENNQCFSPHGYDIMVDTPAYKYASNSRVGEIFDEHRRTQERLGVPVLVGEWGGNSEGNKWFPHVEFLLSKYDANKWSNTYWAYVDNLLDTELANTLLSRPYPKAVAGTIEEYRHDKENRSFTLTYIGDASIKAPTVIYVPCDADKIKTTVKYTAVTAGENGTDIFIEPVDGKQTVIINF